MLFGDAMKVPPPIQLTQIAVTRAQPFKQLLAEARSELKQPSRLPPPIPALRVAVKSAVTAVSATAQTLGRARVQANSEAQRLGTVRTEAHEQAKASAEVRSEGTQAGQERTEARVIDFILREFNPEPTTSRLPQADASIHHLHPMAQSAAPKLEAPVEAKAAQAVALIERIELFVKSQRPGLALTLNNSLGAHVEIERIGPKEIALKLVGHRGPPTAEAVSRIREELRARGLKVGALSVA
jgi:hypothetical protein